MVSFAECRNTNRHRLASLLTEQTPPGHAPLMLVSVSHASVASQLERGECSLLTDVASRALHLAVHPNLRPQQSACPRGSVLLAVAAPIQPERTAEPSAS